MLARLAAVPAAATNPGVQATMSARAATACASFEGVNAPITSSGPEMFPWHRPAASPALATASHAPPARCATRALRGPRARNRAVSVPVGLDNGAQRGTSVQQRAQVPATAFDGREVDPRAHSRGDRSALLRCRLTRRGNAQIAIVAHRTVAYPLSTAFCMYGDVVAASSEP